MKITNTTPEQILEVWEEAYVRLNAKGKQEFKKHKVTKQLCEKRLVDIKVAIFQGKKQYLPEILDYLQKTQAEQIIPSQENHGRVVYVDPQLWAGNYTSKLEKTSTYKCSICESPVIGLKCRCSVAA